jgi:hypothetical protein
MKRILPALAALLLLITPAVAQEKTALDLLRQCEGREPLFMPELGPVLCGTYLGGLSDMHAALTDQKLPVPPTTAWYCAPSLQAEQFIRIFVKHAKDHPENLHMTPRSFYLQAMADAFPCN